MKRWVVLCAAAAMLSWAVPVSAQPASAEPGSQPAAESKLTAEQQKELAQLYSEMFEKKQQIIDKYVEFGALTQEKAAKKKEHLEKYRAMLEQNGYMPPHGMRGKHEKHDMKGKQDKKTWLEDGVEG